MATARIRTVGELRAVLEQYPRDALVGAYDISEVYEGDHGIVVYDRADPSIELTAIRCAGEPEL